MKLKWASAVLVLLCAASVFAAEKTERGDGRPGYGSAGLFLGWGFKDGYDFALGARGGYTLDPGFYFGAAFTQYLGKTVTGDFLGTPVDDTGKVAFIAGEFGYDIAASSGVVIRPLLGLGAGIFSESLDLGGGSLSASSTKFTMYPAVNAMFDVAERFSVGVEARYYIVIGSSGVNAFSALGTAGMRF